MDFVLYINVSDKKIIAVCEALSSSYMPNVINKKNDIFIYVKASFFAVNFSNIKKNGSVVLNGHCR